MPEYVLGTNAAELARLRLQHEVWSPVTRAFLDRLGVRPGARVLDVGCGPGFVAEELAERVGPAGHVVALDESPLWHEHLAQRLAARGLANVELRRGRVQDAELEPAAYDLVFARWVLSFVPELDEVVARLARTLAPGGVLAVEDYNHEGVSLFPGSAAFDAMIRATRALYADAGGDTWVVGRLPAALRRAGLEHTEIVPNVLAGGPGSPVFRWADAFFVPFSATYLERGLVSAAERDAFLADWEARKRDPDALFFSPIVADVAARAPRA